MKSIKQELGKVAVTVEKDYHNSEKEYDKLVIVEERNTFKTYISRKPVPFGIELTNRDYWIPFSGVVESIVFDYNNFKKDFASGEAIYDDAIDTRHIIDRSITRPKIAEKAISDYELDNDAVIEEKIKDSSVTSNKIAESNILSKHIADNQIISRHIAKENINHSHMAQQSVGTNNIINGSITTEKIAEFAIGTDKLSDSSITIGKLAEEVKQMIARSESETPLLPYDIKYAIDNADIQDKPISIFAYDSRVIKLKKKNDYNLPSAEDITVTGATKESYIIDGNYGILNINNPFNTVYITSTINTYIINYNINKVTFDSTPNSINKNDSKIYNIIANKYYKVPDIIDVIGIDDNYTYTKLNDTTATLEIKNVQANVVIVCTGIIQHINYWGVNDAVTVEDIKTKVNTLTSYNNEVANGTKTFTITNSAHRMWIISSKALSFNIESTPYDMNHEEVDGVHYYYSDILTAGDSYNVTMV